MITELVLSVAIIGATVLGILILVLLDERGCRQHEIRLKKIDHLQRIDEATLAEGGQESDLEESR